MIIPGPTREQQLEHDLIDGALTGDVGRVRAAIADGVDLGKHGDFALRTAAGLDDPEVVRLLLKAGVPADLPHSEPSLSALCAAASYNRVAIVRLLLAVNPPPALRDGLCKAAIGNHAESAALIIASGASVEDATEALFWAVVNDARAVIRLLLSAGARRDGLEARAHAFNRGLFATKGRTIAATLRWLDSLDADSTAPEGQFALFG